MTINQHGSWPWLLHILMSICIVLIWSKTPFVHLQHWKFFNKFVPAILQVCFLASSIKKAVTKIISAMNTISSQLASVKKAVKKIMCAINNYWRYRNANLIFKYQQEHKTATVSFFFWWSLVMQHVTDKPSKLPFFAKNHVMLRCWQRYTILTGHSTCCVFIAHILVSFDD